MDQAIDSRRKKTFNLLKVLLPLIVLVLLIAIGVYVLMGIVKKFDRGYSRVVILELTAAAMSYQKDTNYYPGLRYEKLLAGYRDEEGKPTGGLSGSQVLAASVFGLYYKNVDDADPNNDGISKNPPGTYTASQYLSYSQRKVMDEIYFDTRDFWPDPRPLLYWPAIPKNKSDPDSSFRFDDNNIPRYAPYNIAGRRIEWRSRIINPEMGKTPEGRPFAWNFDSFLIIGPSIDGIYFTQDDCANFRD